MRADYTFSREDVSVSKTQMVILRKSQGYFVKCLSNQFPTKFYLGSTPFLLQNGLILELGSVFNPIIRLEVVMGSSDDQKPKLYHDFFRFVRPGEFSSKMSTFAEQISQNVYRSNQTRMVKRSKSLESSNRSKHTNLLQHRLAGLDDSRTYYPHLYFKILKGKEHFDSQISKTGIILIGSLEKGTIGPLEDSTIHVVTSKIPKKSLVVNYDYERGWLVHYGDSEDHSKGAYILLKNSSQLKEGKPSYAYKLYQGMNIAVGYHLFEVSSIPKSSIDS